VISKSRTRNLNRDGVSSRKRKLNEPGVREEVDEDLRRGGIVDVEKLMKGCDYAVYDEDSSELT
jgi:hypothetical protein